MLETWPDVKSLELDPSIDPEWLKQFPLSAEGRNIVTQRGQRFRLRGINWYGASDCKHVVGGLDVQSLENICSTITTLGFNTVRLPFSNEMLRSHFAPGSIDYTINPSLDLGSALEVFDAVINAWVDIKWRWCSTITPVIVNGAAVRIATAYGTTQEVRSTQRSNGSKIGPCWHGDMETGLTLWASTFEMRCVFVLGPFVG